LLEWDDFEAGSRAAYVVGPFPWLPSEITLANRAASLEQLAVAAWHDVTTAFNDLGEAIADAVMTLAGGHADPVGYATASWSWADLVRAANRGTPEQAVMNVDGGPEGHYTLTVDLSASWSGDNIFCQVQFQTLRCIKESTWDRFTSEDEPFVLTLVSNPAGGARFPQIIGPYAGVDTGETRSAAVTPTWTTVPRGGGLIVSIQILESDDETPAQRQQLLTTFASPPADPTGGPRGAFLDALGTTQAPDWRIGDIEVFAFRRNAVVEAGTVIQKRHVGAWLEAGKEMTFPFTRAPGYAMPLNLS
jgi:hypothetical protein